MISQAIRNDLLKALERCSSLSLSLGEICHVFFPRLEQVLDERFSDTKSVEGISLVRIMGEDPESFDKEKTNVRRKAHVVQRSISFVWTCEMLSIIFFPPVYSTNVRNPGFT